VRTRHAMTTKYIRVNRLEIGLATPTTCIRSSHSKFGDTNDLYLLVAFKIRREFQMQILCRFQIEFLCRFLYPKSIFCQKPGVNRGSPRVFLHSEFLKWRFTPGSCSTASESVHLD
jgi:hypothetical protein